MKKPAYCKTNDATVEQRIANNEFGPEILHSTIYDKFCMIGEDNALLGQTNAYSVVTDNCPTIIAAADTQHMFRLVA